MIFLFYRTPQGMTKSQRRDYREKERQRLRDLE